MRLAYPFLSRLKLDENADVLAIRRAYARELQAIAREHDPANFADLSDSFQVALTWASQQPSRPGTPANLSRVPLFDEAAPAPQRKPAMFKQRSRSAATPSTMANAALLKLNEACTVLSQGRLLYDQSIWQDAIRLRLDDMLSDAGARPAFEMLIVRQLAAGWKPGHEALFCAAGVVFNWETERARLAPFGEAGEMISRAIDQRIRFDAQPQKILLAQRKIANRLRVMPGPLDTITEKDILKLDYMMMRYATLLALTVDTEAVLEWRQRFHGAGAKNGPNAGSANPHSEPKLHIRARMINPKAAMVLGSVAVFGLGLLSAWKSAQ